MHRSAYALILAGGAGSRFWPLSREVEPKQFLMLNGDKSLLQETIERIGPIISADRIFIITNERYKFHVVNQAEKFSIPEANIILEPKGKNTAPAIGFAAKLISARDPDAVMVVLPADHYVRNKMKIHDTLNAAVNLAAKDYLVTIGIVPDAPHAGYGYIKMNDKISTEGMEFPQRTKAYHVDKFVEKPDKKKAKRFLKNKKYLWNSGMFVWKTSVILSEIKKCLPDLYKKLALLNSRLNPEVWGSIKPISIDYGVLEKSKKVAVITAEDLGWNDLGSWASLRKVYAKDMRGNVIHADSIDMGSRDITVFGSNRLIATIGLKDVVVVDTDDALLVCDNDRTEDVKAVVETIKGNKRQEHTSHKTVKRPWGCYTVLNVGIGFKVKLITIAPYKRLSLQRHKYRSEHWIVVDGEVKITNGNKVYSLKANESTYIPMGGMHRLENLIGMPLKIVEIQCGKYTEEDDIERTDDDFERAVAKPYNIF